MMVAMASCSSDNSGNEPTPDPQPQDNVPTQAVLPSKTNSMKVYAHYMPWFDAPAAGTGSWGWHWTMNTRNPANTDASGRREIASHYYPLTGPYSSSDTNILDYQCLLMKYSGIDGVMIDWYGTSSLNDYPGILKHTEALVAAATRAGLEYAIVYEDATLNNVTNKREQAIKDLTYLNNNMFKTDNYMKIDGTPVLLIFGPQGITSPSEWSMVLRNFANKPKIVALNGHSGNISDASNKNSQGEFLWVNASPNYGEAANHEIYIAGAMPGFHDYYKEGGVGNGYTTYDAQNGALFASQLQAAKASGLKHLQVSTWNDYGEGTIIEPTVETGYRYLTALQSFTGVALQQAQLEAIYKWYTLKAAATDAATVAKLNNAYAYFNAMQPDKAIAILNSLQ